jgi:hypothetical protein
MTQPSIYPVVSARLAEARSGAGLAAPPLPQPGTPGRTEGPRCALSTQFLSLQLAVPRSWSSTHSGISRFPQSSGRTPLLKGRSRCCRSGLPYDQRLPTGAIVDRARVKCYAPICTFQPQLSKNALFSSFVRSMSFSLASPRSCPAGELMDRKLPRTPFGLANWCVP